MNQAFGKDFYRKGNAVKRFGPFTEPPGPENRKVAVLIPFPKISSYTHIFVIWEFISHLHRTSVTQGFLAGGGILLCNLGASIRYFLCTCQLHTLIVWELTFQLHTHLLHKRTVSKLFV